MTDFVLLDSDVLWRTEFSTPSTNYRDFFETWLRVCKNILQSGRPVVLFGAGAGVPKNIEGCIERKYFSQIHYLALVCSDAVLFERLKSRPVWRGCDPVYIEESLKFNRWFKKYDSQPTIKLVDTTGMSIERTAQQVMSWINESMC
jgi:hypothetical protein